MYTECCREQLAAAAQYRRASVKAAVAVRFMDGQLFFQKRVCESLDERYLFYSDYRFFPLLETIIPLDLHFFAEIMRRFLAVSS